MTRIFDVLRELLLRLLTFLYKIAGIVMEWFWQLETAEKAIALNNLLCVVSITLPFAYFNIFDSRYFVNNPLSITSIVLVLVFFASLFLHNRWVSFVRIAFASYYLLLILFKLLTHSITKAEPYSLYIGFYLAIVSGLLYIVFSVISCLNGSKNG